LLGTSCLRTIVRYAGGGGRPGGVPKFNWKEKKLLNINQKRKPLKLRPYGYWEDIEEFFDPKRDVMLPWEQDEKTFDDPAFAGKINTESDRKRLDMRSLYGSSKSYGMLPVKDVPKEMKKYSYERIFGEKHRRRAAEQAQQTQKQ